MPGTHSKSPEDSELWETVGIPQIVFLPQNMGEAGLMRLTAVWENWPCVRPSPSPALCAPPGSETGVVVLGSRNRRLLEVKHLLQGDAAGLSLTIFSRLSLEDGDFATHLSGASFSFS